MFVGDGWETGYVMACEKMHLNVNFSEIGLVWTSCAAKSEIIIVIKFNFHSSATHFYQAVKLNSGQNLHCILKKS